jgi:F-type H+-transporting ATPase subunit delta
VRGETVARNYAEALFELADREGDLERYGEGIETVARLLEENRDFRLFLETPRVAAAEKKKVLRQVFGDELPRHLLNFLLITIDKRRQRLLRDIARAYHDLLDERMNRVRVEVTVARPMDDEVLGRLREGLSTLLGRTAVPHLRVKPEIVGGVVVRAGDRVYDGSIRRRLERMRRQLLSAGLPPAPGRAE